MQKLGYQLTILVMVTTLAFAFLVGGCARTASEEEMRQLNDLKAEVASLEQQITAKEKEKSDLEKNNAEKNAKLQECAADKDIVRGTAK